MYRLLSEQITHWLQPPLTYDTDTWHTLLPINKLLRVNYNPHRPTNEPDHNYTRSDTWTQHKI